MDKKGKFIVIDGMDGSGKGTQIKLLQEKLQNADILFTREPGGTPHAEEIRNMLLSKDGPTSNPVCDFFLFWAARGSHLEDAVLPAIAKGTDVICDRYDSSTYAFQIYGEQTDPWLKNMFTSVRTSAPAEYKPDLYIVLDLPAEVAYERRSKDSVKEKDRFDVKPLEYHQRVRDGFVEFGNAFGPVKFVNAEETPEEIHAQIWAIVEPLLAR